MNLEMIGINHETSDIAIRDKAAVNPEQLPELVKNIRNDTRISGVVIVSTCNRVEIYISPENPLSDNELRELLMKTTGLNEDESANAFINRADKAAKHLFEVASGLNSQLIGEVQILGQVKSSYHAALELGCASGLLNRLFLKAIECGKLVRERTAISHGAVSVAFAAIDLATKIFGRMDNLNVLIIGAGETGQLASKYLQSNGVTSWRISNRTRSRSEDLANELGGDVVSFPPAPEDIEWADIVVSATGAPDLIIKSDSVADSLKKRKTPICFLDLAVPRDIDPALISVDDVFVYSVDDFNDLVQANLKLRAKEVSRADKFVTQKVESFVKWYRENRVAPTIQQLQEIIEGIRLSEFEKSSKKFCDSDRDKVDKFSKALMKKVIGLIIANMKQASVNRNDLSLAKAVLMAFASEDNAELDKILEKLENELSH